jgi:uncharacterized protein YjbJ (UPF0337 family)
MTQALLKTHWEQIRQDCRCYWGKLTDEDLECISANYERFVAALRQRYGFAQLKAEDELERFLFRYGGASRQSDDMRLAEARP